MHDLAVERPSELRQVLRPHASDQYIPALDGLRAFAVLAVLYHHYWNAAPSVDLGHHGVRLFFVLSGYLITGILLREREAGRGIGTTYRAFMLRRALRLLPAYYLLLFIILSANIQDLRDVAPWYIFQLSNILFAIRNEWEPWITAHYWSLSVEEQFYLVWPLVVLSVSRRWLYQVLLAMTLSGVVFRCVALAVSDLTVAHYVLPFASFDALGAGALLAYHRAAGGRVRPALHTFAVLILIAVIASVVYPDLVSHLGDAWPYLVVETALLVPMVSVIAAAAGGQTCGPMGILILPPIVALGRISYGVYLYHFAVVFGMWHVGSALGVKAPDHGPWLFMIGTVLTIVVASISWLAVERPILRMKRRVTYGLSDHTSQ